MKKLKITLAALFVIIGAGLTVAFTVKNDNAALKAENQQTYYWFDPADMSYEGQNTRPAEETETGCTGAGDLCENGYTQSQLINPGNPSQGVKSGESPAAQIREV